MSAWLGPGRLEGLTTKRHKGAFGGDENVLHLDCGGYTSAHICQNPSCTL